MTREREKLFESLWYSHRRAWRAFDRVPSQHAMDIARWREAWSDELAKFFPEKFVKVGENNVPVVPYG